MASEDWAFSSHPTSKGSSYSAGLLLPWLAKPRLAACVIAALLMISGVERNPGPNIAMGVVAHRLGDLFIELFDTRAALTTKIDKIDQSMKNLAAQLLGCQQRLTSHSAA